MEEQIQVLRLLWTNPLVSFTGRWHHIPDAGLNPLPIQQPIPIWFGGHAEEALRRAARLGDGWMPNYRTTQEAAGALALLQQALEDNQRDPKTFGLEARLHYGKGNPSDWEAWIEDWRSVNVSHITLNTMGCGFHSPQNHLEAIEKFAKWMQGVR
jgi:alkanesulfonate monooxygenase SsuD/methylene tetrahydromethanopterin reductase-like flavin-dependent oxidoreductase (luciferase family)